MIHLGASAQVLNAYSSKKSVLVGEPVELILRVKTLPKTDIKFSPLLQLIPAKLSTDSSGLAMGSSIDVEIYSAFKDELKREKNYDTWVGKYTLMIWDSGTVVIPEQAIIINDSTYYFNKVKIHVGLSAQDANKDLNDIEEFFADVKEPDTWTTILVRNSWWIVLVIISILFVIRQFRIHKKSTKKKPKDPEISLKDRTIFAIESLEKQKLWLEDKLKIHYTELSYIMRLYLSSRYNLNLLERTTIETRILLRQAGLHEETINTLMTILNQADMVKFAKSQPEELTILKVSLLAKQLVAETSPIEFESVE